MSLPEYNELDSLVDIQSIDQEIYLLKKTIFDLKMKCVTNQRIKSHLFQHAQRRIRQLNFKKGVLVKINS